MSTVTKVREAAFTRGYQQALTDVAHALLSGRESGVREWLLGNLPPDTGIREALLDPRERDDD